MKKLMIIATVAIAAIAANASNVRWGTTTGTHLDYTTEGQEGLQDGKAYLVLLSNQPGAYANVTAANAALPDIDAFKLQDGKYTEASITAAGGIIFREGTLADGFYYPAAEAITAGPNGTGKYYAYMVAIGSDGESIALSNTANEFNLISATTPVNKNWNASVDGTFSYAVAPEPTSGLLLLLGVAGLALKRKRA